MPTPALARMFGAFNRSFNFCDESGQPRPLTVIVGPNMSGKTTVLDALHLIYACNASPATPKLRPDFNAEDPALRTDPRLPIRVDLVFSLHPGEQEAIEAMWKERGLDASEGMKPVDGKYQLAIYWPLPNPNENLVRVLEGTAPPLAGFVFRGRSMAMSARSLRLTGEKIFETVGGMLYLDQHRSVDLPVPSIRTGSEPKLREEASSRDVLPWLELISRLDQKWDPDTQGESAWRRVKRLYGALAAPATIDDIEARDEGFDLRFQGSACRYYSAGLSGGERQILRFVANLAAFHARNSVILIDELELHLHPRWQRNLLHFCRQGGDDDNQFIVTTHSEAILRYVDPADVISLGELGDG